MKGVYVAASNPRWAAASNALYGIGLNTNTFGKSGVLMPNILHTVMYNIMCFPGFPTTKLLVRCVAGNQLERPSAYSHL